MKATWFRQLGARDRRPWCLLITADEICEFFGEPIPGFATIIDQAHAYRDKWSTSTYYLELADGVRLVSGHDGWDTGQFLEGLCAALGIAQSIASWKDLAAALGVTVDAAQRFLRKSRPGVAAPLDHLTSRCGPACGPFEWLRQRLEGIATIREITPDEEEGLSWQPSYASPRGDHEATYETRNDQPAHGKPGDGN